MIASIIIIGLRRPLRALKAGERSRAQAPGAARYLAIGRCCGVVWLKGGLSA